MSYFRILELIPYLIILWYLFSSLIKHIALVSPTRILPGNLEMTASLDSPQNSLARSLQFPSSHSSSHEVDMELCTLGQEEREAHKTKANSAPVSTHKRLV